LLWDVPRTCELLPAMQTSNFDAQTMAVLVLWGADTECEPFRSQRQQLELSIPQRKMFCLRRNVKYCVGRHDRCQWPTTRAKESKLDPRTHDRIDVIIG